MVEPPRTGVKETNLNRGVENGSVISMEEVHVRKRKDGVWRVRETLTVPDWALVELFSDGKPRTARQAYAALGKQFTRKTLIRSLRMLSMELRVLEPQHIGRYIQHN